MHQFDFSPDVLEGIATKTVIITGSARGIGASAAALFNAHGANTVLVDLPSSRPAAEDVIASFVEPKNALFIPANVTAWSDLVVVFQLTIKTFGKVDMVVANAAVMESAPVLDVSVDESGNPIESAEAIKVLDINLKGTFNVLRLALHYLQNNPQSPSGWRGSVVFVTSTSGYFGSTGNAAYISSKHGVVGLMRAALGRATSLGVRLNAVAPCFTPTHLTAGFGEAVAKSGLEINTTEDVAMAISSLAADESLNGVSCLVWGKYKRELEIERKSTLGAWLGSDLEKSFADFGRLLESIGGYPLPDAPRL